MSELFTMTRKRKSLTRLMFAFFLFAFIGPLQAQQSRGDSIILLLNKSRIKTGIDSATFLTALNLINQTTLTDSLVIEIESEGAKFNKRADEDLSYFIKFAYVTGCVLSISAKQ